MLLPGYDITKHDVDKFLSESNRPSIKHRLLIATTDRIGGNAKQVCDAQEKPVTRFLLSNFNKSELDYPANFAALPQAKRKDRPVPHDQFSPTGFLAYQLRQSRRAAHRPLRAASATLKTLCIMLRST